MTVRTEQSLSGGGLDVLTSARASGLDSDEIPGEAEKMKEEFLSILGRVQVNGVKPANIPIQVSVRRVNREYGHIVNVTADLHVEKEDGEIREWMENYSSRPQALELPSAPPKPFIFVDDLIPISIPDPATDLKSGMTVRISDMNMENGIVSFKAWSENTIRGAAGGTVLLAELAVAEGLLGE